MKLLTWRKPGLHLPRVGLFGVLWVGCSVQCAAEAQRSRGTAGCMAQLPHGAGPLGLSRGTMLTIATVT